MGTMKMIIAINHRHPPGSANKTSIEQLKKIRKKVTEQERIQETL